MAELFQMERVPRMKNMQDSTKNLANLVIPSFSFEKVTDYQKYWKTINDEPINEFFLRSNISRLIWPKSSALSIISMMEKLVQRNNSPGEFPEWWESIHAHPEFRWLRQQMKLAIKNFKDDEVLHEHDHQQSCTICKYTKKHVCSEPVQIFHLEFMNIFLNRSISTKP